MKQRLTIIYGGHNRFDGDIEELTITENSSALTVKAVIERGPNPLGGILDQLVRRKPEPATPAAPAPDASPDPESTIDIAGLT